MRGEPRNVALGVLLVLLGVTFYPTLILGRRVAPEASLRSVPPWRIEWGPTPDPPPQVLAAATQLGPRLEVIGREGTAAALWDPWIGGGRAGWLSSPREGGAPLPVLAALLARPEWVWTSLVALTVAASFLSAWLAIRWLGASGWAAAAAATAYTFAGPVAWHWLDWQGSAVALGPLALLPALAGTRSWGRAVSAWAAALCITVLAGPPALPFVAIALAHVLLTRSRRSARVRTWTAIAVALVLVVLALLPIAWLAAAGAEPGARPQSVPTSPPARLSSLMNRAEGEQLAARAGSPGTAVDSTRAPGLVGVTALLLAGLGLVAGRSADRRFWVAAFVAVLALSLAPTSWLARIGVVERPMALLAFTVVVFAARGVDEAIRRLPPSWTPAVGGALCLALAVELGPVALAGFPLATAREAQLPAPVPLTLPDDGSRVMAMMSALPPDTAAGLGLADVRARWFDREPAYEELVTGRRRGPSQVLDPVFASLGARWLLEPMPMRVVSGLVFGDIDVVEASRISPAGAATARYELTVPERACRLGLPRAQVGDSAVFLQGSSETVALEEDRALAEESADWRWVGVRRGAPRGNLVFGLIGDEHAPASLSVAIDVSGIGLAAESQAMRVWRWDRAARFARLDPAPPPATVALMLHDPERVEVDVHSPAATNLVVQVKYRPFLWRATVNGRQAPTTRADRVWTAVPVSAGASRVVLVAALPTAVWALSAGAVMMTLLLAVVRRTK